MVVYRVVFYERVSCFTTRTVAGRERRERRSVPVCDNVTATWRRSAACCCRAATDQNPPPFLGSHPRQLKGPLTHHREPGRTLRRATTPAASAHCFRIIAQIRAREAQSPGSHGRRNEARASPTPSGDIVRDFEGPSVIPRRPAFTSVLMLSTGTVRQ